MANTRLKVAVFSMVCGRRVRVAGKGLTERRIKVDSLESKDLGEENAPAQRTQRLRREVGVARRDWRLSITSYVTRYGKTLSSIYWSAIRIGCGKVLEV